MSITNLENWMHASDEERSRIQQDWNVTAGDGREIATAVAGLFAEECVYNVDKVKPDITDDRWYLKAWAGGADYESLKDRDNIEFLGFKISFYNIQDYNE